MAQRIFSYSILIVKLDFLRNFMCKTSDHGGIFSLYIKSYQWINNILEEKYMYRGDEVESNSYTYHTH